MVKDEGATAAFGLIDAPQPGPQRHPPFGVALASTDVEADHLRLADLTGLDHLLGQDMGRIKDKILVHAQHNASPLGCPDHSVCLGHTESHRLLYRYVLARLASSDRHFGVEMVGDQELDQIHLGIGKHPLVFGIDSIHAPGFGFLLGAPFPGITHRDDAGILAVTIAELMQIGDASTADDGSSDRQHPRHPLSRSDAGTYSSPCNAASRAATSSSPLYGASKQPDAPSVLALS